MTHTERRKKRVDINEFAKGLPGEVLHTSGVATCTAIAVLLPGKFGYLAHITPTDEIYIANELSGFFLGDQYSDFWGELIGKIEHFDVYPYELKELDIAIIAPHDRSFARAVDEILDHGIELSRIKVFYNPEARGANVLLDVEGGVEVEWYGDRFSFTERTADVNDLGTIVKKIQQMDDPVDADYRFF